MRNPKNKSQKSSGPPVSPFPTAYSFSGKRPEPEALKRQQATQAQKDKFEDILVYGADNAFPLRIAQAVEESPAGSACIDTTAQFIKGSGFSDKELMKHPIDNEGTTLWDLHSVLSDSMALFWGFAVNFKFDKGTKITNTFQLPFESCRFAVPTDKSPYIKFIKYNPYYGTEQFNQDFTETYPVFNIKEAANILGKMEPERKAVWPGQAYYYGRTSPLSRFYPKPSYWSAKKWLEIDARIQAFHSENLDNGFFQSVLMQMVGDPHKMSTNPRTMKEQLKSDNVTKELVPTKTVGEEFNEMMRDNFSGYSKAGNVFVQWVKDLQSALKIQEFPSRTNADLFTALQDLTTKNITIATKTPSILANISEGVSLGSAGSEIQKAIELMQSNTADRRAVLESFYNTILLPNLQNKTKAQVKIVNYNPVSQPVEPNKEIWAFLNEQEKVAFIKKNIPEMEIIRVETAAPTPGTPAPVDPNAPIDPNAPPAPPPAKPNEALKELNLTQIKRITKIVAQFATGTLTFEQAKQILMSYGLTEEELNAWLVTPEEI